MTDLLELGKKAAETAQKLGADEAEVFLCTEKHVNVKFVGGIFASRGGAVKGLKGTFARIAEPWIKKKGVPFMNSGARAGVGVRAIVDRAMGFASVSSLEEKKVLGAVEEAVKIAKIRPPDPNWVTLPEPEKPLSGGGVYDKRIADMSVDELLSASADCCVWGGNFDKRIVQTMSMVLAVSANFCTVNTRGIEAYDERTVFSVFMDFKAKRNDDEVSAGESVHSRKVIENLQPIAASTAQKAVECLGRKPLPEKYMGPVVFENTSWADLFSSIFPSGISAFNVQESRSVYKGKMGQQVAGAEVSIIDDGTLPDGVDTVKVDDEGVPKQKTPIIENGVLQGFLHDNYSAKRENARSTGSASRQRAFGSATYANQPMIRPSNLTFTAGKRTLRDLISELGEGVLVKGFLIGSSHSNVVTGDFSVTAGTAFKIEKGDIAYPLKPCTVAGNLYESLTSVISIGNDLKYLQNVLCPSVIVDKIVVST
ncbi:MAG: TldD/PmbA family protein [Candidatus Bathyarchaeota archaeon]|jgi:PmbA protein|nr:TldD/PmbA family protein [Candidatus Bathyarchaeota archaeon]